MPRITRMLPWSELGRERASMRPGRNAPDNPVVVRKCPQGSVSFNEAGAKCPG